MGIWKLAKSKRAPSLGGWKNFKEPPGSRQFEVDIWNTVWEPQRYMITMNINLDTHRHRQTDRSHTDWSASCLSVRPAVRAGSAGGLKRRTVVSDRQTDVVVLYIRWVVVLLPFHHLLLPGWRTWMDVWRDGWMERTTTTRQNQGYYISRLICISQCCCLSSYIIVVVGCTYEHATNYIITLFTSFV